MFDICIIFNLVLYRSFSLLASLSCFSESGLYVSKTRITSLNPAVKVVSLSLKLWARSFTVPNVLFYFLPSSGQEPFHLQ